MPTITRREVALSVLFKFSEDETAFHIFIPEKEDHDNLVQELRAQRFMNNIEEDMVHMVPKNRWNKYRDNTCLILHKEARDEGELKLMSYRNIKNLSNTVEKLYQYISGALYSIDFKGPRSSAFSEVIPTPIKKGIGLFSQKSRELFDETLAEAVIEQASDVVSKNKKKKESNLTPNSSILSLREEHVFDMSQINVGGVVVAQFKGPSVETAHNYIVSKVDDYMITLFDGQSYEKVSAEYIRDNLVVIKEIIRDGER